jgi:alpha-L-fucosidase 2
MAARSVHCAEEHPISWCGTVSGGYLKHLSGNLTRRQVIHGGLAAAAVTAIGAQAAVALNPTDHPAASSPLTLWYDKPATQWGQALPLGNGRLGAMVFGGVAEERIGLNEDSLWSGGPYSPAVKVDPKTLEETRRLIFAGKAKDAQNLEDKTMEGNPRSQAAYQTVGDLVLTFSDRNAPQDYRRELSLDDAVATTTYRIGKVKFRREVFASPVDQAIVVHLTADRPGSISFDTGMVSPQVSTVVSAGQDTLRLSGQNGDMKVRDADLPVPHALTFQSWVRVLAKGGTTVADGPKITVSGADEATLLIVAATSYKSYKDVSGDPQALCAGYMAQAQAKPYARLKEDHLAEHRRLFGRVRLDLGTSDAAKLPTNERPRAYRGSNDPAMAALYFQFGRYLLLSSSRRGGQPANLQGMWNHDVTAAWGGKYTLNINTEMNYWPAYGTNLAECDEPLFAMVKDLSVTGQETARRMYGARGWVCHHNTDLWRATAPIDGAFWGMWPMGGAWLCNTLYQRQLFLGDTERLAEFYPILKGAAEFFLDTLVEQPGTKWLVTCPSMSPEHEWTKGITASAGPTMDMQILRELFANCVQASSVLQTDAEFRAQCAAARARLAPMQVGKAGQLQEWLDDVDATVPDVPHRHMSPLYGLFPGNQITPADHRLSDAARKLMEMRTDKQNMGWAVAWRVNLWARLLDAERAHQLLTELISTRTEGNLFDMPSIQLDGNFGGTSGIAEMLLQSQNGEIALLPALPSAWPNGMVSGLLARGGYAVAMEWKGGKLSKATLSSTRGGTCRVRCGTHAADVTVPAGSSVTLDAGLHPIPIPGARR